jgi:twitching motility protein PilJ
MTRNNFVWSLLIRSSSFFAVILLLTAFAMVCANYFGWMKIGSAEILLVFVSAVLACFSIIALNFSEINLKAEHNQAAEYASRLAQGNVFDDKVDKRSELITALKEISDYRQSKMEILNKISIGDLSGNIALVSDSDYFGQSLQNMIEKLRFLVQTEEERDQMQKSILQLLKEVSEVSAGDLTVVAEVTPEMTGAIAEAFNSMTKNLRSLIRQVKNVTLQVGASANAISETTGQLAHGSETQASQISRTTSAISNMALQIQEVSHNASLSAQVAGDSLNNARYGTQAVQDNINAMNGIRKQVQETAKRIKKLGQRSQEISQIVRLIDDLSDRTGLLALNASLQAAAEGGGGHGFALVAEEVERLAERSNRLTQQIADLAQTIQIETKDVVASMEETIHEVVIGSTLADRAGQALVEIEQVSKRLARLIDSISESAQQQATSSEDISKAMANISKVTELVQNGSKRAADSVKILVFLADELRGSVTPFKLPEDRTSRKKLSNEAKGVYTN